jgi:hypothetical protein
MSGSSLDQSVHDLCGMKELPLFASGSKLPPHLLCSELRMPSSTQTAAAATAAASNGGTAAMEVQGRPQHHFTNNY